jgi:hypothetical protein
MGTSKTSVRALLLAMASLATTVAIALNCASMECGACALAVAVAGTVLSATATWSARGDVSLHAKVLHRIACLVTCLILPAWYLALGLAVGTTHLAAG